MKSTFVFFAGLRLVLLVYGTYQGVVVAPREETMGEAQRIFYYHVPAATAAYSLFLINFVASLLYLWKRSPVADAWAIASAEVGVVFATVTLALGIIWARYAWGHWWAWDMRLTTFLVLWLLYVSYLVLRSSAEAGSTSVLAAAMAVIAFLDVPFNYMANRWFRTNHPQPVTLTDPAMKFALMSCMIAFFAFAMLIVWFRFDLERLAQKIAATHVQRAARRTMACVALPAVFLFFQDAAELHKQQVFMYSGYIVAWIIYIGYLVLLMSKLMKLKAEAAELGA